MRQFSGAETIAHAVSGHRSPVMSSSASIVPQASQIWTVALRLSALRVTLSASIVIFPQRGQAKCPPCCFCAKRSISALASFSFIEISPFSELFDDVLRVFAVVTLNPSIGKDFNVSGALVAHVNQQRLR